MGLSREGNKYRMRAERALAAQAETEAQLRAERQRNHVLQCSLAVARCVTTEHATSTSALRAHALWDNDLQHRFPQEAAQRMTLRGCADARRGHVRSPGVLL